MGKIRVGINGFGRIGRAIFRINELNPQFEIVAVNDIDSDIENHEYLLKYDTIYGRFEGKTSIDKDKVELKINGNKIKFYSEVNISKVPWPNHKVDIIIDSSGVQHNVEQSRKSISSGLAKKIITTHSPKSGVDKTIIFGVNEESYLPSEHNVVSTSICDSNASGPILNILEEEYGIKHGFITTLHPWLSYQNLVDGSLRSVTSPGHYWKDYALGRASTESLIPKSTTLVNALEKVIPNICKNIEAFSYRVPTGIVSSSDMTIRLKTEVNSESLNNLFKRKSQLDESVIGYQEGQLVSIDFKGIRESTFVDGRWTKVLNGKTVKLVLWYDNEWGYSYRVFDMVNYMSKFL